MHAMRAAANLRRPVPLPGVRPPIWARGAEGDGATGERYRASGSGERPASFYWGTTIRFGRWVP